MFAVGKQWWRALGGLLVAGGLAATAGTVGAAYAGPVDHDRGVPAQERFCARQFDRAMSAYVRTTERRDARGFNALLAPDTTVIFANGGVLRGKHEVAEFITDFFTDPGWTQTFKPLTRHVEGCRSGFVLFDSVYSVPAEHRVSPLVIGVTFTYQHGRWLVLHNQDSTGPAL